MVKHNYLLLTYNSDSNNISVEKLYCTKRDAKRYMAQQMWEWIREIVDASGNESELDSAWMENGSTQYVEYYGLVQFSDWHVTFELIRSKLVKKTEVNLQELTDFERVLLNGDRIDPYEDDDFNWETGRRIRD